MAQTVCLAGLPLLATGVSGELLEARAFDMWAGGEWLPQHPIIFSLRPCLLCLCTQLFKYSFGLTKYRDGGSLSGVYVL